ncbi:hypothetical protein [Luteolibacter soli]|uniref:DUF1080 domain-containing protein n=1 Tax=Luteolibacter soli TaxID=3135280 RepID=A0ABU9B336_9BACT
MDSNPDLSSRPCRLGIRLLLVTSGVLLASLPLTTLAAPEFQKKLSDEGIATMCKQWHAAEMITAFASPKNAFASAGGLVSEVHKGSYAERHGIVPGSMLISRGDLDFGGNRSAFEAAVTGKLGSTAGKLVWATPDNVLNSAPIADELIGVDFSEQRNMTAWFLRNGQRDKRWDELVVTALVTQDQDPAISESCWAAAAAKGYKPDPLLHWCGMFLSLARADYAAADAHATAYGEIKPPGTEKDFPLRPTDISAVAFLTGEMKRLLPMVKAFDDVSEKEPGARYLEQLASKSPRPADSPSKLADRMKHRSFLQDGTTKGPPWTEATPDKPDSFKVSGFLAKAAAALDTTTHEFIPERLEAPVDHYRSGWLVPSDPARDVDVEITFQIRAGKINGNQAAGFTRAFNFGLCNNTRRPDLNDFDTRCLMIMMDYTNSGAANEPAFDVHPVAPPGQQTDYLGWNGFKPAQRQLTTTPLPPFRQGDSYHTLRVVRVGDWAEALFDGKRIALAPVPPELTNPGMFLRIVGCEITAKALRADVLE